MHRNGWRLRTLCLSLVSLPLAGCLTAPREVVVVRCGTIRPVSKEQLKQSADELARLPHPSVLADVVIPDWVRLRDEIRACRGAE
jgi:hypothetical protein